MSTTRPRPVPDLDAEQEVDFGRYVVRVAARWWLPLLGLVAGVVLGYLVSIGGEQVYRAQALIYLGDPLAPSGARVDTLATTPGNVREIVTSEAAILRAASESDLDAAAIRAGVFVSPVTGSSTRSGQPALINVGVRGEARGRVRDAANELARIAATEVADYADAKIASLKAQIAAADAEIGSLNERIAASLEAAESPGLSDTEKLIALTNAGVLEQRRGTVAQARADRQQLLAFAENVERPRVVEPAVSREVTAQSPRNAIVAAGALGLLAGLLAALLWDPVADRVGRRPGA